jgi:2-oxoisovalerate dehydrogenase E1 component alpha subunit
MDPIQLLAPSGELHPHDQVSLIATPELCRGFFRQMSRTRRFDAEALALQRQGELGLWLRSLGQEATQVGSITAVRPGDYVFPAYREHGAALCRGIPAGEQLSVWRGVSLGGWNPRAYRFHLYTLVLGAQLLHATGYAMGVQRDGAGEVVLAYFGDGAASEGDANEAFVWAARFRAPVIFFCQNNGWALSTPVTRQTGAPLHQRARAFGLDAYLVDGNDVLAVHAVTRAAAEAVRCGSGPVLIEGLTYRIAGHSTADDPARYRTSEDVERWHARDPLARLRSLLDRNGWADTGFYASVDEEVEDLAAEARRQCLALPEPDRDALHRLVYVPEDGTRGATTPRTGSCGHTRSGR